MKAIAALFDLVPGWLWAVALAAVLGLSVTQEVRVAHCKAQLAGEKQAHAETRRQYAEAAAQAQAETRKREQDLRDSIDAQRRAKDVEIKRLRADVLDLRERLSNLPARPAGDSGAKDASFGQAAPGCAGPVLYRDTAEALAAEAERGDLIRIELKACYAAWDKARELMSR